MSDLEWPEEYRDIVPHDSQPILEMRESPIGSTLPVERFFYLGSNATSGIAIWLAASYVPSNQEGWMMALSLSEVEDLRRHLSEIKIDARPKGFGTKGGEGFLRICTSEGQEMNLKWRGEPADSWNQILDFVNKIRLRISNSLQRQEIPLRKMAFNSDFRFSD